MMFWADMFLVLSIVAMMVTLVALLVSLYYLRRLKTSKHPVAWRVKDYADGWIIYQNEAAAYREAEHTGALMQSLYLQ